MTDVTANTRRLTEKAAAATAEEARRAEQSALAAADGLREYYQRLFEMAHENTAAGLDVVRELARARTPQAYFEIWSDWVRDACGTFSKQTKELSDLAQSVVGVSVQPLTARQPVH